MNSSTTFRFSIAFSVIFGWSSPMTGQTEFSEAHLLFGNNPPERSSAHDLDGDGDLDVLIAGEAGLSLVENTGGMGSFGSRNQLSSSRTWDQVADIDGDGDPDILSFQRGGASGRLVWHRNDGGVHAFSEALLIDSSERITTLLPPLDMDGDGDLDLIWHDGIRDAIRCMIQGEEAGQFASPHVVMDIDDILFLTMVDLNGDGTLDFVGRDRHGTNASGDDELIWIPGQNTTPLTFGQMEGLATNNAGILALGDLDGDSDLDILTREEIGGNMKWLPNSGNGTLGPANAIVTGVDSSPQEVCASDYDGDGDLDLLFSLRFENLYWCENTNGAGQFSAAQPIVSPSENFLSSSVADFNGDQIPDLLLCEESYVRIHYQTPSGTIGTGVQIATAIDALAGLVVGNINTEPGMEIVFGSGAGVYFAIANQGQGQGQGQDNLQFGNAGQIDIDLEESSTLMLTDLDDDDTNDLVTLQAADNIVSWLSGDGGGGFGASRTIDDFGFGPSDAAFADFDGNGTTDVAVAFGTDEVCSWYSQSAATQQFSYHSLSGTIGGLSALASGDLDGDGDSDLLAGSFTDGNLYLYLNPGNGNFGPATLLATSPIGLGQIEIADMDGDGLADVLVRETSGVNSTITLLRNSGGGMFPNSEVAYSGGAGVSSMGIGDLDEDGDFDIVTVNFNTDAVLWHENGGQGDFQTHALATAEAGNAVRLGDLDDDGDLDVVVASGNTGVIRFYENKYRPQPPSDDPIILWAWDLGISSPEHLDLASDGDGDGWTLLEEFAYNLKPQLHDGAPVSLDGSSGSPNLWYTFNGFHRAQGQLIRRRDHDALGLTYIVETSRDLQVWIPITTGASTVLDADYERVTFIHQLPQTFERHFTRVRLVYQPIADQ